MSADIPPSEWAFHTDTGRPCLDFVATAGDRAHLAFDRWREPQDLARWCVEAGLLAQPPGVELAQLKTARTLREAIYRTVAAVRGRARPRLSDVAELNRWAARPTPTPELADDGRSATLRLDSPLEAVFTIVARDAIELLTGPLLDRVRQCAESTCSVLFVDASRPGKRRWCSMSRCGNRRKKAAYRRRLRRAGRAALRP
jgi:predicted RNA-binding Zn ribbon-like protein